MSQSTARKQRPEASAGAGPKSQPKAGSLAQREMIERLADRIMEMDRALFDVDLARNERGDSESDLAFSNGRKVTSEKSDGEQVTYKEWKADLREVVVNIEASYPALMPAVRKLIRKTRKELDTQDG